MAAGEPLSFGRAGDGGTPASGRADTRSSSAINAEDPVTFAPSPGTITTLPPARGPGVRVDTAAYAGWKIPPHYDSLIAKLIVHGRDREEAIMRGRRALELFVVEGVKTTIPLHLRLLDDPDVRARTRSRRSGSSGGWRERHAGALTRRAPWLVTAASISSGSWGAGRRPSGRRLAERLGVPFVDLDAAFEAHGGADDPRDVRDARRAVVPRAGGRAAAGDGELSRRPSSRSAEGRSRSRRTAAVREAARRLGLPRRAVRGDRRAPRREDGGPAALPLARGGARSLWRRGSLSIEWRIGRSP